MAEPAYTITNGRAVDAREFDLDSYIMHVRTTHCTHCGADHTTSQVYEVHINPSLTGRTAAHRLVPAASLKGGFKIGISKLPTQSVPVCHDCLSTLDTAALPIPDMKPVDPREWAQTLRRKYAPQPVPYKPVRPIPKSPTLDDL